MARIYDQSHRYDNRSMRRSRIERLTRDHPILDRYKTVVFNSSPEQKRHSMPLREDASKISLKDIRRRIETTDLIPSRTPLLHDIVPSFDRLEKTGLTTLDDLQKRLKNKKTIAAVAGQAGIDVGYLMLLRREIEGYFPKDFPIEALDWLPHREIMCLKTNGFTHAAVIFEELDTAAKRAVVGRRLGIDVYLIATVHALADLTRIQWTGPATARILVAAGYDGAEKVAKANGQTLCDDLDRVNRENGFSKVKIGLRDVQRLIKAASYVTPG